MKLATILPRGAEEPLAGVVADGAVRELAGGLRVVDVLAGAEAELGPRSWPLEAVTLLPPVPEPGTVYAIGMNYANHVREMGADGRIGGYCIADDVTARDLQGREPQWTRAKGADTFCPVGPWVTTADEIPDPGALTLRTWVNGELRQESSTAELIFGCQELVEFIGQTCTLQPGDLILTGTPNGVGMALDPPRFLRSGEVVRIEIDGLGRIEHPVACGGGRGRCAARRSGGSAHAGRSGAFGALPPCPRRLTPSHRPHLRIRCRRSSSRWSSSRRGPRAAATPSWGRRRSSPSPRWRRCSTATAPRRSPPRCR